MSNGALYCNRCGAQNAVQAKFCANCGAPFSGEVQPSPPAEPFTAAPVLPVPSWQPPASGYAPAVPGVHYAGFWIRFVAAVIDGILVSMVIWPFAAVVNVAIALAGGAVSMPGLGVHVVNGIVGGTLYFCAGWIYEAAMESSSKQATIGKLALGLKVTDLAGARISFARATGRHFAKIISKMILLVGYIMAGFTERKQALHDMIAGTLVRHTQ